MKLITVPSSGSVANLVYSRNRGGQYTRNRTHPAQPAGTGRRAAVKGYFRNASLGWKTLTAAEQAAWDACAAVHPITNTLGQTIFLTAQQMFIRINTALQNVGLPVNTAPPTSFAVFVGGIFGFAIGSSAHWALQLLPNGSSSDFYTVSYSKETTTGHRSWFTWWQAAVYPGNVGLSHNDNVAWHAQFGPQTSGGRVFVKVTPVSSQGIVGVPVVAFANVP